MSCRRVWMGAAVALPGLGVALGAQGSVTTPGSNTITLTGTDGVYGPNAGAGTVFYSLLGPQVSGDGGYSFGSETGNGQIHLPGVWTGAGAARSPLALSSGSIPGWTGGIYSSIDSYSVVRNDVGETIFTARPVGVSPPNYNNVLTYFAAMPGSSVPFARQTSPTTDPTAYNAISGVFVNGARSIAYYGDKNGAELWLGEPGVVRSVAKAGLPAPGTPAGTLYSSALSNVDLNRSRSLLYRAELRNSSGVVQGTAMYVADDVNSTLIAKSTDLAPGQPPGTTFGYFGGYGALADDGQAAVLAQTGLYIGHPGNLRLSAAAGQQAPGLPAGVQFADVQTPMTVGTNAFMFQSNLTGPGVTPSNEFSIWRDQGSGPQMVVRDGQSAPGLPSGVVLNSAALIRSNSLGQIQVDSMVAGPGVNSTNDVFEFVWDPVAGIVPVGRAGDSLLLGTGAVKTIQSLSDVHLWALAAGAVIPGTNSTVSGPTGMVAYIAYFTDGSSGTFSLVVPSPSGFGVGGVVLCAWVRRRRR